MWVPKGKLPVIAEGPSFRTTSCVASMLLVVAEIQSAALHILHWSHLMAVLCCAN
jgi:hypothetical protein